MALTRSPGVRPDGTRGTNPREMRRMLAAFTHNGAPGIITGLGVSGTSGWAYQVAAGWVATRRSTTDGLNIWSNDAPISVATTPAPGSGSRIDRIYALHNDIDQGDATSEPEIGVVQGTASGSPSAPALPTGAIEIARKVVAAGDTDTSSGAAVSSSDASFARMMNQPYAEAVGTVTITPAEGGAAATQAVSFPAGRFRVAPRVMLTMTSGMTAGTTVNYWVQSVTADGAVIGVSRSNTTNVSLVWHAIQMTTTAANG